MEQTFFTDVDIKKVRHMKNIYIPLDKEKRKHLILTGKNGSGKTSVLEAIAGYFQCVISLNENTLRRIKSYYALFLEAMQKQSTDKDSEEKNSRKVLEEALKEWNAGICLGCTSDSLLQEKYGKGNFIFAYYKAEREFRAEEYKNIEKIELQNKYGIAENPGTKLTKYLVDLKATQAFTKDNEKYEKIDKWFQRFENILKIIFEDKNLELKFNEETFQFSICETDREPFDFNTMSSGYAAVLDIINDLIIRMEAKSGLRTMFDMEGVVLVDEIETHLHLELQKKILPILTNLFPNIQFIITTHSPFILNSLNNAVIYDL